MKTLDVFNELLLKAQSLQQERNKKKPLRFMVDNNPPQLDPEQPILHEAHDLIVELMEIVAQRMKRILAANEAGELTRIQTLELLDPLKIIGDYLEERLKRCTVNLWPGPGERFGRLTVIEPSYASLFMNTRAANDRVVTCRCDCGNEVDALLGNLTRGNTTSCGCWAREKTAERVTIHGETGSRLYWVWNTMKERVSNPNATSYERYGGRGITICPEWRDSFEAFMTWAMANGYRPGLQIDRVDNDGPYCPSNCKFSTRKAQARNTRRNVIITCNGRPVTLIEASELTGIPYGTLIRRRRDGWPESHLLDPLKNGGGRRD